MKHHTIALLMAAGSGERFGGDSLSSLPLRPTDLRDEPNTLRATKEGGLLAAHEAQGTRHKTPKQYLPLGGKPVFAHAYDALAAHPKIDAVAVVIAPETEPPLGTSDKSLGTILGGATRQESVRLGLEAIAQHSPTRVVVHDAARPFLSSALLDRLLEVDAPAVIPALPMVDTVRMITPSPLEGGREQLVTIDRSQLLRVQSPQIFDYAELLALHQNTSENVTDDAGLFEAAGKKIATVPGDPNNEKLTTQEDYARMQQLLSASMETRVGMGFDVHSFDSSIAPGSPTDSAMGLSPSGTKGLASCLADESLTTNHKAQGTDSHLTLCGIKIAHSKTLKGHSDADVGLHALVDALLGAMAEGDIGQHFPPSDDRWKGADSSQFVTHARDLLRSKNGTISHIDLTIIGEKPKVGPHRDAMRARIAELLKIDLARVSVKATTTEKLGFIGREEGLAAQAVATVQLPSC